MVWVKKLTLLMTILFFWSVISSCLDRGCLCPQEKRNSAVFFTVSILSCHCTTPVVGASPHMNPASTCNFPALFLMNLKSPYCIEVPEVIYIPYYKCGLFM
jgi:hypothetical protein